MPTKAKKQRVRKKASKKVSKVNAQIKKQVRKEQRRIEKRLDNIEYSVLGCVHLESMNASTIARHINLDVRQVEEVVGSLESMNLLRKRSVLGKEYEITPEGIAAIEPRQVKLDTRIEHSSVRDGQETSLWILAKNQGNAPLNKASLRITSPQFVEVTRFNAQYGSDGSKNVVDFPLTQLHPGEMQAVQFRIRGCLTSGAVASSYKIHVAALAGEEETDSKQLDLAVTN